MCKYQYKRCLSVFLACFLFLSVPFKAYATSVAVPVSYSVGSYIVNLILNACGIDLSLSSVASVLGQWSGYEDYMERGSKGQLGAFSQYLYDGSQNAVTLEAREEFDSLIHTLNDAVNSSWGSVVSGVKPLIAAVKEWLATLIGYGTETVIYTVPASSYNPAWTMELFCTTRIYPLVKPTSGSDTDKIINDPDRMYFFTSYTPSTSKYVLIRNWYKRKNSEVLGLYDESEQRVWFYMKDAASASGYIQVSTFNQYEQVDENGLYAYHVSQHCSEYLTNVPCAKEYLGNLPFRVFLNEAALRDYCLSGTIDTESIAKLGEIGLDVLGINVNVQKAALAVIPDVITLPDTAEAALKNAGAVSDAISDEAALKSALGSAGLVIDWTDEVTDIPDNPGITDTDIKELMEKVAAIPAQITDSIFGQFDKKGDEVLDEMSIPDIIMSKFPFCIPFDIIYLIRLLMAEREIPRFEIPIAFDYLSFHYREVFILDFADYDTLVTVFRVMLDLLFCVCLITGTRALIRG